MFKIKQKIVFGLLLMSTAMIFMNYQVKADNGEAIFDQQTLEEVESKIEGKRIFQDKSYDGSENIKAERRPTGVYPTRKGVILVIKDKYKDYDYTEGRNRTYYYVVTDDNEEFHVTKDEYNRYNIGEKMYVLRYSDGSGNNIYSTEEYFYRGIKLKENK